MKLSLLVSGLVLTAASASSEPPLYVEESKRSAPISWIETIQRDVPPLKHDRGKRWPIILWESGPIEVQTPEVYQALLARGLTQPIHLDEKMIPIAQALEAAGSPVIMMQGAGGQWPASLAGDRKEWAHQFDAGFQPAHPIRACPAITKGWAINADDMRATLGKYRDAGITVNAVWMDWEGDPLGGPEDYEQASNCSRCRATLPPGTLSSPAKFYDYSWRRYLEVTGSYLAAPVAEIYPQCSTTNWRASISTPERPLKNWMNRILCPSVPPGFTASNPVAYGNTVFFQTWNAKETLDREHVDQFYTHLLLRDVSDDAANRLVWAPHRASIPWVCRWCPDDANPQIPVMTRERYREVLRHLWLRSIAGMQVFNPTRKGYEQMAVTEVQDALMIYDEMLTYREFLEKGTPLNLAVPAPRDDGVLWSGLRYGNRAIVRTFKPGGSRGTITIDPWPGMKIKLQATSAGKTWLLTLENNKITVGD